MRRDNNFATQCKTCNRSSTTLEDFSKTLFLKQTTLVLITGNSNPCLKFILKEHFRVHYWYLVTLCSLIRTPMLANSSKALHNDFSMLLANLVVGIICEMENGIVSLLCTHVMTLQWYHMPGKETKGTRVWTANSRRQNGNFQREV